MAYIGRNPAIGTQKVLDSLESQFNGVLTTFDLRYLSNTIYPPIASALIVSLGGVLQEPGEAYTVASDTITFASAPPAGADCWILLYTEFGGAAGATANLTVSNNLTIGNELHGPANFVIDPATIGDNTGTVEIKGDLTVQGTTTTINSTTLTVDDKNIALASGAANAAAADGAGITVDGANATLTYNSTPDAWSFNKNVGINTSAAVVSNRLHIHSDANEQGILLTQDGSNFSSITSDANRTNTDLYILEILAKWNGTKAAQITLESGDDTTNKDDGRIKFSTSAAGGSLGIAMRIDPDGYVGIGGDHDPLSPLHISVNTATLLKLERESNANAAIRFENTVSSMFAGLSTNANFFGIGPSENLGASTTQFVVRRTTGNVGIGTTDPDTNFHVYNGSNTSAIVDAAAGDALLTLRNAGNTNWSGINFTRERNSAPNVTGGSIWMPSDTSSTSATLYIQTQSASAGAGVDGALSANNGVRLKLAGGVGTDSAFSVEVGASERLRIDSSGNVGIGTTDPQALLDVANSTAVSSYFGKPTDSVLIEQSGAVSSIQFGNNRPGGTGGNRILQYDRSTGKFQCLSGSNGSELDVVTILNNGNVGIGTDNPLDTLSIGDSNGTGKLSLFSATAAGGDPYGTILFRHAVSNGNRNAKITALRNGGSSGADLAFYTRKQADAVNADGGLERMRIDSDGKVGIGTSDPDTKLQIDDVTPELRLNSTDGTLRRMSFTGPGSNIWYLKSFGLDGTFNNSFEIAQGNDSRLFLQSGGNVGIGTDAPASKLDVNGTGTVARFGDLDNVDQLNIRIASGYPTLYCPSSSDSLQLASLGSVQVAINSNNNTDESFRIVADGLDSGGSELFKIDTNGNFKVFQAVSGWSNSTNHPILMWDYKLGPGDMMYMASGGNTTIADQMALVISDGHGFKVGKSGWDGSDTDISTTNEFFRITTAGNVGIGTTNPTSLLHLAANAPYITFEDIDNNQDWQLQATAWFALRNQTTASELLRVTHTGNVGIGTDSPLAQLDILSDAFDDGLKVTVGTGIAKFKQSSSSLAATLELLRDGVATSSNNAIEIGGSNGTFSSIAYDGTAFFSGNVGIGTASPHIALDVSQVPDVFTLNTNTIDYTLFLQAGDSGVDDAYGASIGFSRIGGGSRTGAVIATKQTTSDADTQGIAFLTHASASTNVNLQEQMLITHNGLVGIGTGDPDGTLHVETNSAGTVEAWANADDLTVENNGPTGISILAPDNQQAQIIFGNPVDNIGSILRWKQDENELQLGTHKTAGFLTLKTAVGVERVRIDAAGNVGIGTTSPNYKLEVNGDIKIGELGTLWFSDVANSVEKIVGTGSTLNLFADSDVHFYESDTNVRKFTVDVNDGQLHLGSNLDTTTAQVHFDYHATSYINGSLFGLGTTSPAANLQVEYGSGTHASATIRIGTTNDLNIDRVYSLGWGDPSTTQMGMGPYSNIRGIFDPLNPRHGLAIHVHQDDEFSIRSSGWDKLFGIEGGTGRAYHSGNVGFGTVDPQCTIDMTGHMEINGSAIGGILTSAAADDTYVDVTTPVKGGHCMITVFSSYDTHPQPVGSGMMYFDVGNSRLLAVVLDTEVQRTGSTARLISGGISTSTTATDWTDGAVTVTTPAVSTLRFFNRVGSARQFKIVFL